MWEIRWRVVLEDGRRIAREQAWAIAGETLEFVLSAAQVGVERESQQPEFWGEPFQFTLWGSRQRPVGPVRAHRERPRNIPYQFRWTGRKHIAFSGRPRPYRQPSAQMSSRGIPSHREPEFLAPPVDFNLEIEVLAADSSIARDFAMRVARTSASESSASRQGQSSRTEQRRIEQQRVATEIASRLEQRRRADERERRADVMRARAQVLGDRAPIPGLIPFQLLTRDEIDALSIDDAGAYALLLSDLITETPVLDLHPTPYTVWTREGPIACNKRWRYERSRTHARLWETLVPTGTQGWVRQETYESTPWRAYSFELGEIVKVKLPRRNEIITLDAGSMLDEWFEDQLVATFEFVAIEVIGAIIPIEALLGRALAWIGRTVLRPMLAELLERGLSTAARGRIGDFVRPAGGRRIAPLVMEAPAIREAVRAPIRGVASEAGLARPQAGTPQIGRRLGSQRGRGEVQIGGAAAARRQRRVAVRRDREMRQQAARAARPGPWYARSPEGQQLEHATLQEAQRRSRAAIVAMFQAPRASSVGAAAPPGFFEALVRARTLTRNTRWVRRQLTAHGARLNALAHLHRPGDLTVTIIRFLRREDGAIIDVVGGSGRGLTPALRTAVQALRPQNGIRAIPADVWRGTHAEWEALWYGLDRGWVPLTLRASNNICGEVCEPMLRELGFEIVETAGRPLTAVWRPWDDLARRHGFR